MSAPDVGRDDARLATALREGLAARDRSARTPHFATVWPSADAGSAGTFAWKPVFAAFAVVAVVAGLLSNWLDQSAVPDSSTQQASVASVEAALAHALASSDYWRVPTDELLAYAAPPLNADLPSPSGFEVSLEESLL